MNPADSSDPVEYFADRLKWAMWDFGEYLLTAGEYNYRAWTPPVEIPNIRHPYCKLSIVTWRDRITGMVDPNLVGIKMRAPIEKKVVDLQHGEVAQVWFWLDQDEMDALTLEFRNRRLKPIK
jgi:hypothetical protein